MIGVVSTTSGVDSTVFVSGDATVDATVDAAVVDGDGGCGAGLIGSGDLATVLVGRSPFHFNAAAVPRPTATINAASAIKDVVLMELRRVRKADPAVKSVGAS